MMILMAGEIGHLKKELAAMTKERDELRKDAERYRWLRAQNWNDDLLCVVVKPKADVKLGYDCPSLVRLDEAIDEQMEKP